MRRRWFVLGLAALLLVTIGFTIGRRAAGSERPAASSSVTVTVTAPGVEHRRTEVETSSEAGRSPYKRTAEGAAAAATAYLSTLSGPTILDPAAVRRALPAIVSAGSRDELVSAYATAAIRAREQLGVEGAPDPSVVLRTASVGYRIDGFQRDAATVSVWRVGIVGAGSSVAPRQSWRTETVSLVWEDGTWKIDAVRSSPGPTPPLAGVTTDRAELPAAVSSFEEFSRELP